MSEPTSSHVSTGQAAPREAQTQKSSHNEPTTTGPDRIDYVDAQECQKTRQREMGEMEDGGVPVKRIHGQAELEAFLGSQALDRILQVLLGISNRTARFGIVRTDKQVVYLRDSILASAPIRAIIHILEQLDLWISDIPLDPAPQRFGNKAFKLWGLRLESEAQKLHASLIADHHKPIEKELLHHFKTAFGSFGRLDYGTGHELSFLAYLSILHLTRILKPKDLLLTGLVVYQKYFNLCRKLHRVYNLEPAGSKGVYGLDDYFHVVYIFGSAQLLNHPTITPAMIMDEKFVRRLNDLKQVEGCGDSGVGLSASSVEFMEREGLRQSLFFESVLNTITLKSRSLSGNDNKTGTEEDGEARPGSFLDHSPILLNLATNVKGWPKIYTGLIKMMKGEIFSKLPVMQHFWIAGPAAVLPWKPLPSSVAPPPPPSHHCSESAEDVDADPDYANYYRHLFP
ncbi:hypothetical protein PCANC_14619 [Puccinia coronata f. sp. avenae]|uniref:Serine/threonine-protein phosphatase 2A activator n=1 Tax=Puccinia coronata f. sp. avenae TaxID=200324 RepID=A0A2N5SV67_9BASI|nr:hypothetical protein PCANC_14619 [Puccinia coronata f. sp. avenae]